MGMLQVIAFAVAMVAMWLAMSWVIAHFGGWSKLAEHFQTDHVPPGKAYYMRSGSIGVANYGGCLNLRVCAEGLHLSVLYPFRIAHPPLLIPWDEFHSTTTKRILFYTSTDTYVGTPVITHLSLPRWVADCINDAQERLEDE